MSIYQFTTFIFLSIFIVFKGESQSELSLNDAYALCTKYAEINIDSALYYCRKATDLNNRSSQDSLQLWIELKKAIAHSVNGEYDVSTAAYFELIPGAESQQDQKLMEELYNNIGIDMMYTEEYEQSVQYFQKAYDQAALLGDSSQMGLSLMNIGMSKGYLGDLSAEKSSYKRALFLFESIGDVDGRADVLLNLGTVGVAEKNYTEGLDYFDEALAYYESVDQQDGVVQCLLNFAETYQQIGDNRKAINYAKRAYQGAQLNGLRQDELYALEVLYQSYEDAGDPANAFKHLKGYHELENEIFNIAKAQQLGELTTKYETEQKQNEIELLQAQNDVASYKLSRYRYITGGLVALAVLLLGIAYLIWNKVKLQKELLETEVDNLKNQILIQLGREQIWDQSELVQWSDELDEPLSTREIEMLELVLQGKTNAEISEAAYISINTVKFHLRNIYAKLGVANRKEAKSLIKNQIGEEILKRSPNQ